MNLQVIVCSLPANTSVICCDCICTRQSQRYTDVYNSEPYRCTIGPQRVAQHHPTFAEVKLDSSIPIRVCIVHVRILLGLTSNAIGTDIYKRLNISQNNSAMTKPDLSTRPAFSQASSAYIVRSTCSYNIQCVLLTLIPILQVESSVRLYCALYIGSDIVYIYCASDYIAICYRH